MEEYGFDWDNYTGEMVFKGDFDYRTLYDLIKNEDNLLRHEKTYLPVAVEQQTVPVYLIFLPNKEMAIGYELYHDRPGVNYDELTILSNRLQKKLLELLEGPNAEFIVYEHIVPVPDRFITKLLIKGVRIYDRY